MLNERIDNFVNLAFNESGQTVKCQLDPVIGHTVLWKVVCTNTLVAFASANLRFSLSGILGLLFGKFLVE